jgi:hypothetical protein
VLFFFRGNNKIINIARTSTTTNQRSASAKAAGKQIHRQRMGAVMGPTVVRQKFQVDADGSASVDLVRNLMRSLQWLSKKVPSFQLEPAAADAHINAYKKWLHQFLTTLGYQDSSGYMGLHILRKHIIAQTILASCEAKPSNASEAEQCLQSFSSSQWFSKQSTMKRLADLMPDQGEYLQTVGSVLKAGALLGPHIESEETTLNKVTTHFFWVLVHV